MKLFADATVMSFYATDTKVKNLHAIEVNSIKDFVYKYSLDEMALMDSKVYCIDKHDELILRNQREVPYNSNILEIDFTKGMSYVEIFKKVLEFVAFEEAMLKEMRDSGLCSYKDTSDDDSNIYAVDFAGKSSQTLIIKETDDKFEVYYQE